MPTGKPVPGEMRGRLQGEGQRRKAEHPRNKADALTIRRRQSPEEEAVEC